METFVDLRHDRPQTLIELQRRRGGSPKLGEDRHFPGFPALCRKAGIAPALNARKNVAFRHFRQSNLARTSPPVNYRHRPKDRAMLPLTQCFRLVPVRKKRTTAYLTAFLRPPSMAEKSDE